MLKAASDKVSEVTDKYKLANPIEVINEELGGETRVESKIRRDKGKEPVKEITIEKETITKPSKYKAGGNVSSASKRADGCAIRGKTKGTIVMCGGGMYKK
jgi:hypothetical protein